MWCIFAHLIIEKSILKRDSGIAIYDTDIDKILIRKQINIEENGEVIRWGKKSW